MRFGNIQAIYISGWVVPLILFLYIRGFNVRKSISRKFAHERLLPRLSRVDHSREKARAFFSVIAVVMMVIALAEPQWGFLWKKIKNTRQDIIIAVDTSKSMLAGDVLPDRLAFVKKNIKEFITVLRGDRAGLMAFSGEAFMQCPLTRDYGGFLLALNSLGTSTIPRGGTSISDAIEEAIRSYKGIPAERKNLVLITDGENTEGDIGEVLQKAVEEKITIFCIGIGTGKGELIPLIDGEGSRGFMRDKKGELVRSALDEKTLIKIAEKTGGMYIHAGTEDFGLKRIYSEMAPPLAESGKDEKMGKVHLDRYQIFLFAAIIFLLWELFLRLDTGRSPGR